MISYNRLWETMKRKNLTQYDLLKLKIDTRVLDCLRNNKNITMLTLEKVCRAIGCEASDVVSFEDEED